VLVDSAGQLGTTSSSRRFKKDIKPMDKASKAILALKPVTFHYKSDKTNTRQFGLVAEEVAAVNPDLVVRDADGEIYTVRYEAVNAMLLNEFLKEHMTVQKLKASAAKQEARITQERTDFEATIAQQQKEIKTLAANVKEQASQIQKVSAQLEITKPATKVALRKV
jgi:trimeric autotransporter adhesin